MIPLYCINEQFLFQVHSIPLRNFNPDNFLKNYREERNKDYGYNVNKSFNIPWNRTVADQRPQRSSLREISVHN